MANPEIRFKSDAGQTYPDWGQTTIGALGSFLGGGTPSTNLGEYWKGTIPWVSSADLYENDVHNINISRYISEAALNNSATKLVPKGSIAIICRVGVGKVAITCCDLCTSQDFTSLIPKADNPLFLAYAISVLMRKKAHLAQGTSIKGIAVEDVQAFELCVPVNRVEQQKIATFFTELDNLIVAASDEVAALEEAKKGMIQKIFSREIRFKRDDGSEYPEWENLPLESVVEPHNIVVENPGNGYIKLAVRSHCKGTFHKPIGSEEDGLDVDKMYMVKANHLIVNITFAWEHAIAITKPEDEGTYVSHRFPQYQFVNGNLPSFYEYVIKDPRMKYEMGLCSPGGAGRNRVLNQKDFLQISVVHPHIDEQRKIATFLSSLDDAIAAAKDELAGYRELKRGMLQKMFA